MVHLLAAILSFFLLVSSAYAQAMTEENDRLEIRYPASSEDNDPRYEYPLGVLELALMKAGVKYDLKAVRLPSDSQVRSADNMAAGDSAVNLAWYGTSTEFENMLKPIRIPISRGLLGHRIAITHKDKLDKLTTIKTKEDFMSLNICQGLGWPDTDILKHNGFTVSEGEYSNLFKMLDAGRCDVFLRGVHEPYGEVESRLETMPNLVVDENIMIKYKMPMFFFVSYDNPELAEIIERGLKTAYEDGCFKSFFEQSAAMMEVKEKAKVEDRICLEVENPFLTEETQNIPVQYWGGFDFGEGDRQSSCLR